MLNVAPGAFCTRATHGHGFYDQNKLASYDDIRNTATKRYASIPVKAKGDPAKAMEVLVDVVRGEGVARDKPWPEVLVLGEDAEVDIREKCERTLRMLDRWKTVSASLNVDGGDMAFDRESEWSRNMILNRDLQDPAYQSGRKPAGRRLKVKAGGQSIISDF